MKTYGGVKEIFHASSVEVGLADTETGELQALTDLFRGGPDVQWNASLKLWIIWH